jgi:hypothetical protein
MKRSRRAAPAAPASKTCRTCGIEKALADFGTQGRGRLASRCRPCEAARSRERYWAVPPDVRRERRRARRLRHLEAERARSRRTARSERGRQSNRISVRKWKAANPEKVACHRALQRAVRRSEVRKPSVCEILGCSHTGTLHGHHQDYRKPREAIFACHLHHEATHHDGPQRLKPGARRKFARPPSTGRAHRI